ncbi:MAG: hypothetical protein LUH14_11915 [Clostridiaceae bacterium]|nr:hypothetical protein [Clostridiaceae bacterium]
MEEKIEDVLKEYPITFTGKKRIRGAILLEAENGIYTLTGYSDSVRNLLFQEAVKARLMEQGCRAVDKGIPNEKGEMLTRDGQGNRMLLRQWFPGRECSLRDRNDVNQATKHLAYLHGLLCDFSFASGEEDAACGRHEDEMLENTLQKRKMEMKHAYNYIRKKKKKNDMEMCILQQFQHFFEQAQEAEEYLEKLDLKKLNQTKKDRGSVCHGSYNYHNVIFGEKYIFTTNFQNAQIGLQINDLYDFLRKTMEKNSWNTKLGLMQLEAYQKQRPLQKEEAELLYVLLLFPEKFWKQINFYYNGKKSWMSGKNYEKLLKIASQEEDRRKFLQAAKGLLI